MFCKKCGKELKENTKFCASCGAPIEEANNIQEENQNANIQSVGDTNIQSGKMVKLVINRNKKMLGFAIGIVVELDGTQVTVLKNGQSYETEVTVGQHQLLLKTVGESTDKLLNITPELNKVCVNLCMQMGLLSGKPAIESVTTE